MRQLTPEQLKKLNLFKHYRIIRKWASRNNNLKEPDLELLIYLDCIEVFSKIDFKEGSYSYSWDNRRWNKLLKYGWIKIWRERNRTTQKYNIYSLTFKSKRLINTIYKIILGEIDIPISTRRNKIMLGKTYTEKVLQKSIHNVNKDKYR